MLPPSNRDENNDDRRDQSCQGGAENGEERRHRQAPQRFTDKAYNEISTDKLSDADFGDADGDIVYVSFASPAAKQHATQVMESDAWRKLSAVRDNRVFVVNNEVWQSGQGVVAARGMLDDLRWINAPIN